MTTLWATAIGPYATNTRESPAGVLDTQLPGSCSVWHFTLRSEQPFRTFVLACPGVDAIRLWPLPVQPNWAEDWFEHLPPTLDGQQARITPRLACMVIIRRGHG